MDKDTTRRVNVNKTLEEVRVLNAQNDKLLKDFGIDVLTFADPVQEQLDQFAQIRLHTGLCLERPEMSLLEEFLYQREAKQLEAKTQAITLSSDVVSLRLRCDDETKEVARLESFLEEVQGLATTTDEFEKERATLEKNHKVLKRKLQSIPNIPDDINLDELIANIQLLEEENSRGPGNK
uniref:Uncharacterized protein n=1 Tax=Anopheles epiroticus TaxID=199890 RepID=A0A182PMI2_9DIPT